jgi:hypothetical protein
MFEKFKFRKFDPPQDIILYANTMLSQVMDMAPADSACVATMVKVGNNYLSSINIASSSGHFKAESKAQDPRICIDILDERIKLRIKEWQNNRNSKNNENNWISPNVFSQPKYA